MMNEKQYKHEHYRKYSSFSYLKNNITLSCYRCNTVKSGFFNFEEMKKIGEVIKQIDLERKQNDNKNNN